MALLRRMRVMREHTSACVEKGALRCGIKTISGTKLPKT
jgi:hypothetical protein